MYGGIRLEDHQAQSSHLLPLEGGWNGRTSYNINCGRHGGLLESRLGGENSVKEGRRKKKQGWILHFGLSAGVYGRLSHAVVSGRHGQRHISFFRTGGIWREANIIGMSLEDGGSWEQTRSFSFALLGSRKEETEKQAITEIFERAERNMKTI